MAVPSGKRLHHYGKSPVFMGKLTITTGPFSIAILNYQRVIKISPNPLTQILHETQNKSANRRLQMNKTKLQW